MLESVPGIHQYLAITQCFLMTALIANFGNCFNRSEIEGSMQKRSECFFIQFALRIFSLWPLEMLVT